MVSAANRAAKALLGASRNRPSRSMSQSSGLQSSFNSGGDNSGEGSGEGSGSGGGTSSQPSSAPGSGPSFMNDVQAQYESLSEKLARENERTAGSTAPSSLGSSGGGSNKNKVSRKVRWAQTAAIASTMDANNGNGNNGDDDQEYNKSPMDILSDLFQKKYTLPVFLVATFAIFLMVHLAGGPGDSTFRRYDAASQQQGGGKEGPGGGVGKGGGKFLGSNRQHNVGGGDGFGDIIFSASPTTAEEASLIPTIEVIHHTTPKISPPSGASPSVIMNDGNEPGWIVVPTQSGVFGVTSDADDGGMEDTGSDTLKWGHGPGVPTPDPALLLKTETGLGSPDDGSPTTLKWGNGFGEPTPDPIKLGGPDDGSPTTLVWNYPPGVPTPNPALLVEVAPPDDKGSPTTLKWGGLAQSKPKPAPPIPTPKPAPVAVEVAAGSPDAGSPTTLKWQFPPGEPTPDPALLVGSTGEKLVWGYPPGVPTPDPILLEGGIDTPQLEWGYPPGIPTPDPILLTGGAAISAPVGWGYPEGEPTPDPIYLNGIPPGTEMPTKRNVETGLIQPTNKPTKKPTGKPTEYPITNSPIVTLKVVDLTPDTPREPPAPEIKEPPVTPIEEPLPPQPLAPSVSPVKPPPPVDENGNIIELAPPEPVPRQPRPPRPQRPPPRAPRPKVNTQPYNGPGGYTFQGSGPNNGRNPDWNDPYYNGPNGYTVQGQGVWPDYPNYPDPVPNPGQYPQYQGVPGGYIIPQQTGGCGCCCCHCGGGGMVGGYAGGMVLPQGYMVQQQTQGGAGVMLPIGAPLVTSDGVQVLNQMPHHTPECPWDCLIDENVPTMGRSNEDDALYEIFYTNPLNCCGTIVEVGAEDGKENSTSYFFEKGMNWTTILTEADPTKYSQLSSNRNGTKAKPINGAFCKEGPFLYFDNATSAFKSAAEDDYSSEALIKDFETSSDTPSVKCIRLDEILGGVKHVNVMIIRVKGDPWAVVRTMDWNVRVDIWVILTEDKTGISHDTMRAALKLHDYVPASWDIKLWCDAPGGSNCMQNEVWLRKNFNPIQNPFMMLEQHHQHHRGLRGSAPGNGNLLP